MTSATPALLDILDDGDASPAKDERSFDEAGTERKQLAAELQAQGVAEETRRRADVAAALAARSPEAVAAAEEWTLEIYPNRNDFRLADRAAFATSCAADIERERWVDEHGNVLKPTPEQAMVIRGRVAEIAAALIARFLVLDGEAREVRHDQWDARAAAARQKAEGGDDGDDGNDPGMGHRPSASAVRKATTRKPPAAGKPRRGRGGRAPKQPRIPWNWAPAPRLIASSGLPAHAQAVTFQIAEALDIRLSNRDLHVDVTVGALAERLGLSYKTVRKAIGDLQEGHWLEVEPRGNAGLRVRFTEKCYRP